MLILADEQPSVCVPDIFFSWLITGTQKIRVSVVRITRGQHYQASYPHNQHLSITVTALRWCMWHFPEQWIPPPSCSVFGANIQPWEFAEAGKSTN